MSRRVWRSALGWGWRAAPGWLVYTGALLVAGAVTSVLYPVGLALVIDSALAHRPDGVLFGVLLVAFLYTVSWALAMLAGSAGAVLSDRTSCYLTAHIAEQLHAVSGVDHLERHAYLTELDLLQQNLRLLGNAPRQILLVIQVLVRTLGIVVILAVIYPLLGVLPLAALFPVAGERLSVWLRQRSDERLAADRRLANELFELATSAGPAKELRVFGVSGPLRDRHRELSRRVFSGTARASVLGGLCGAAGWLLFAGAFVAGIAVVVVRAADGTASVGAVVLAVTLVQRAQLQVGQAAAAIGQLLTTARTARRLLWLEDYAAADRAGPAAARGLPPAGAAGALPPAGAAGGPGLPPAAARGLPPAVLRRGITLREVSFGYPPDGGLVLDGVDVHLPAGAAVALVGENGAGKTTLVKLLTGMYQPTAGQVLLDGVPLADLDLAAWRERTAATFQDFVRFELLAAEAVGVGDLPRMSQPAALESALERADATAVASELPAGLRTRLGRSFTGGQELSGGQWQRLALARGMMRDLPLLLILDEPTASLDAITEAALFERYLSARQLASQSGAITLLVSHRFSTVRMADLIVVLDQGRITASGDHAALIRAGGLYAELYELQARAYR
ncbi:MAG TPA: ABC transporter ATP-binding protein [Streptosporangiaceae bacterium]|nr:ABC transporter ATP-binding protein [Streptosporangiaceae bacterium]